MDIPHETTLLAKVLWSAAIVLGLSAVAERVSMRIAGILAGAPQGVVLVYFFVDVLLVEVRRCTREGKRIAQRIAAYAELPIVSLAASAPNDVQRIATALERTADLFARAERALATLHLIRRISD